MESSNQFLGTERIGKLMQKYAIPCIISLLVGALYNIVDQIFIANASYLGSYGNAANTVVFPLTVVALAIAVMIGDGCCAFVSISLGQNEVPKAKRSVGNAVVMCLVSSILLTVIYLIFADTILAILSICIFLVTYGRMIEIYVVTALGPIPLATMGSSEWRSNGQNYLKSLLALGFQAFLIMIVVGIYAVLIRNISGAADIAGAIWGCMGYTVLLCFCLFKTGSISKSVFGAH